MGLNLNTQTDIPNPVQARVLITLLANPAVNMAWL